MYKCIFYPDEPARSIDDWVSFMNLNYIYFLALHNEGDMHVFISKINQFLEKYETNN